MSIPHIVNGNPELGAELELNHGPRKPLNDFKKQFQINHYLLKSDGFSTSEFQEI